jgi:hypothetical protein
MVKQIERSMFEIPLTFFSALLSGMEECFLNLPPVMRIRIRLDLYHFAGSRSEFFLVGTKQDPDPAYCRGILGSGIHLH